jgi:hypothetical protein
MVCAGVCAQVWIGPEAGCSLVKGADARLISYLAKPVTSDFDMHPATDHDVACACRVRTRGTAVSVVYLMEPPACTCGHTSLPSTSVDALLMSHCLQVVFSPAQTQQGWQ